ncbi:hypothetical protein ACLB2K_007392 [Fragaria x ananassa]
MRTEFILSGMNYARGMVGRYRESQLASRYQATIQSALSWGLSRGDQSVRTWLGTVAMWRVSPRLIGDCREVASQSALDWGLRLYGESVRA